MSQGELYPTGDAGQYRNIKGCWVDFVFYCKSNDP